VGGVLDQPVQQVEGLHRQGLGGLVRLLGLIYAGPGDPRVNSIFGELGQFPRRKAVLPV